MNIPCPKQFSACAPCSEFPFLNTSAEEPDSNPFIGIYWQAPQRGTWTAPGCQSICESLVSQQAADECAARQAIECSFDGAPDDGNPLPGGGRTAPRFGNELESCESACPEGSSVTVLVAPGTVISATQADANARAHGLACKRAEEEKVCFSTLSPLDPVCVGQVMSVVFDAYGGMPEYVFSLDSGAIPLGVELNAQGNLFGVATVAGTYTFTLRVTDAIGTASTKQFTLLVTSITPVLLPNASVGVPYSQMLMLPGAVNPVTWALISGALPDGLTLDPVTGIISGTPTGSAVTSAFSVEGIGA